MVGDSSLTQSKQLTIDELKDLILFARDNLIFRLDLGNFGIEFSQLAFVPKGKKDPIKVIDPVNQQEIEKQKQQEEEEIRYYSAE